MKRSNRLSSFFASIENATAIGLSEIITNSLWPLRGHRAPFGRGEGASSGPKGTNSLALYNQSDQKNYFDQIRIFISISIRIFIMIFVKLPKFSPLGLVVES